MLFKYSITTAANTPSTNKKKTVLKLLRGKITQVIVVFPPGPSGLLHLQIFRSTRQLYPINEDGDLSGDNIRFVFPDDYFLIAEPYQLEAYTWNEDDTFSHTLEIYISLSRSGVFIE